MSEGNSERRETDPTKLAEQLEIELMLKRASWQQAKARRGSLRAISFAFLFLIIVGALLAFWFLFSSGNVEEMKASAAQRHQASPSPTLAPR